MEKSRTRMMRSRSIVGYVCCAILAWMSVAAGYFPAAANSDIAALAQVSTAPDSSHHGHLLGAHAAHGAVRHGEAQTPGNPVAACIATCLELVSHKIIPKLASNDLEPKQVAVPVQYGQQADPTGVLRSDFLAYWPTGPPEQSRSSASGAARLVARNARLRI